MKTSKAYCVLALCLLAVLAAPAASNAQTTTSYSLSLNPGTSAGNPVTNIMIFEAAAGGSQLFIDYGGSSNAYTVSGTGLSTLTHTSPFVPEMSLIVGLTQQVAKVSLVILMNNSFAAQALGLPYNQSFFATNHSSLINHVLGAGNGVQSDLDWFQNVFWPIDGSRAAFQTGGSYTAMEFTTGIVVGPAPRVPERNNTALLLLLACAVLLPVQRYLLFRRD